MNGVVQPARRTTRAQTVAEAIEEGDACAGRELVQAALAIYGVVLDDASPSSTDGPLSHTPPREPRTARRRRSL